jgi:hypothetical protein
LIREKVIEGYRLQGMGAAAVIKINEADLLRVSLISITFTI